RAVTRPTERTCSTWAAPVERRQGGGLRRSGATCGLPNSYRRTARTVGPRREGAQRHVAEDALEAEGTVPVGAHLAAEQERLLAAGLLQEVGRFAQPLVAARPDAAD